MKTRLRLLFMLLAWMALMPSIGHAQNEGTAFSCDGTFYQIRQVGTTSSLYRVNRSAATYTTTLIRDLGVLLNGLAYNPQDGYMYALSTTGTSGTLPTSLQMYKIGQGGIQPLGTVSESGASTGLSTIQIASGTIDKSGYYYVSSQNSAGTANYNLYRFNIGAATPAARLVATPLRLRNAGNTANVNLTFYDIALNPADDLLYAVFNNGTLWRIDANGTSTNALVTPIDATQTDTEPVGTSFFDVAGNLFVYTNGVVGTPGSGDFYQVNLVNGVYTRISGIDPASVSDGASCINPDQRIDIAKEATSITRVGGTGLIFDIAFTLRIKNTSTTTDNNVQVNDFLWSGTGATVRANTTFSSTTGKLPTSVVIQGTPTLTADPSNVNPVFALVRNTGFTGVGGAPGVTTASLLTGNQPLTAGQAAIITFTVRVTYPNTANVPAGVNNTAYASSTTGANATGYSQQTTAVGFISSPNQLVASDLSTDGPSLPVVANGDTPTPTPVFFSTSIVGTVFEDISYGGGIGRTQLASNGVGVEGVRVELYSNAGAFLTFDITDAAGNYSFATTDGGTTALAANTNYQVRIVNQTVNSTRPGTDPSLRGVQTFKLGVTNQIGGTNPNRTDLPANTGTATGTGGQTLTQLQATNTAQVVQSILTVTTPAATATSPVTAGVDFGFNFSTVVNTNDAGPGSLRQFILNSNALTNENLAQRSSVSGVTLTPGVEYAIFMMNNGTTITNGLRLGTGVAATTAVPTGYNTTTRVFTISPTTSLPAILDDNTAIDGKLQSRLTGENATVSATSTGAEIAINFGYSTTIGGLISIGAETRIASLELSNALGSSLNTAGGFAADGSGITFSTANAAGSVVTDVTTTGNAVAGVLLQNGATDVTVSSNILVSGRASTATGSTFAYDGGGILLNNAPVNIIIGNTISGNNGFGIEFRNPGSGNNDSNSITGNIISGNGGGTASAKDAGISLQVGNNNLISGNTITGNSGDGIMAMSGTSGNRLSQNNTGNNNGNGVAGNLGIDLSANNNANGDAVTLNADGKTAASGANGLQNFPVITQATIFNGNLLVTGFARTGAVIEFFIASADPTNFGEGATFFATATENSTADTDGRIGSYSGVIGNMGLNQGSETNASRFAFSIPVNATQIVSLAANKLTATATIPTTVNGLSVGNTSEFSGIITVANTNSPLPVELKAFEVAAANASALLTWSTASEKNNDHFDVERSFDGGSFERIGQVQGRGTTSQTTSYSFTDSNIGTRRSGVVYYRLQQVDTDGTASYSPVRTVSFAAGLTAGVATVGVYPNPSTSQDRTITLALTTLPQGTYEVTVLDATGRVVRTQAVQGGQDQTLQVQQLPAGMYLVQVRGNSLNLSQRFSKQ